MLDENRLFKEWSSAKSMVSSCLSNWSRQRTPIRWRKIFHEMVSNAVQYVDLAKAGEFVLHLPATTVPVERVFLMMNVCPPEKLRLNVSTLQAVLCVRELTFL